MAKIPLEELYDYKTRKPRIESKEHQHTSVGQKNENAEEWATVRRLVRKKPTEDKCSVLDACKKNGHGQ